jgi:hypothetical protein
LLSQFTSKTSQNVQFLMRKNHLQQLITNTFNLPLEKVKNSIAFQTKKKKKMSIQIFLFVLLTKNRKDEWMVRKMNFQMKKKNPLMQYEWTRTEKEKEEKQKHFIRYVYTQKFKRKEAGFTGWWYSFSFILCYSGWLLLLLLFMNIILMNLFYKKKWL